MNKEEKRLIEVCKSIITSYLATNENGDSLLAIYNIRAGDTEVLYSHIKAYCSMFNKAK